MTVLGNVSRLFLNDLLGYWVILICLAIYFIIAKGFFQLSVWRSILIALIFYVGILVQYCFLFEQTTN